MTAPNASPFWISLRRRCARAAAAFLFPTRCLACEERPVIRFLRGGVCEACWTSIPAIAPDRCPRCDESLGAPGMEICGRCLIDPPAFASLRAAAPYRGSAREILLAFKFRGADFLAPRIADVMCGRLGSPVAAAAVAAVPARRAAVGGHNPAVLLGEAIASLLSLPFLPRAIAKRRGTERQSRLPLTRRAANVRGAFRAEQVSGTVLLVDDVATSGATARECARVLRRAGADRVEVWCFTRASRIDPDGEEPRELAEQGSDSLTTES